MLKGGGEGGEGSSAVWHRPGIAGLPIITTHGLCVLQCTLSTHGQAAATSLPTPRFFLEEPVRPRSCSHNRVHAVALNALALHALALHDLATSFLAHPHTQCHICVLMHLYLNY